MATYKRGDRVMTKGGYSCRVLEVREPQLAQYTLRYPSGTVGWRDEAIIEGLDTAVTEMTIYEIEVALGYTIKVVK